jgi:hypothetical protein
MNWVSNVKLQELVAETLEDTDDRERKNNLATAFKSVPPDLVFFGQTRGVGFDEDDVLLHERIEKHRREQSCSYDEALSALTGCTPMSELVTA